VTVVPANGKVVDWTVVVQLKPCPELQLTRVDDCQEHSQD
jgi:hypothetical protein